jgi:hypothetical protein
MTSNKIGLINITQLGKGFALLNCNYSDDNRSSEARAEFNICDGALCDALYPMTSTKGNLIETGQICRYKNGEGSTPCYDWLGDDASIDYLTVPTTRWRTLDFDTFRAFGHKETNDFSIE